jgi:hypothetical protein
MSMFLKGAVTMLIDLITHLAAAIREENASEERRLQQHLARMVGKEAAAMITMCLTLEHLDSTSTNVRHANLKDLACTQPEG